MLGTGVLGGVESGFCGCRGLADRVFLAVHGHIGEVLVVVGHCGVSICKQVGKIREQLETVYH